MVVHATPAHFSIIGDRVPRTGDAEVRQGKWQMGGRFITRVLAHLGRFSPDGEGDLDGGDDLLVLRWWWAERHSVCLLSLPSPSADEERHGEHFSGSEPPS